MLALSISKHAAERRFHETFVQPVDIASLVAFRALFGLVMVTALTRFMLRGWVQQLLVEPQVHFTFEAFPGVRPWPSPLMHLHCALLIVAALGIALGCAYRLCSVSFLVGFTYLELIDKSLYLNHYYLVSLLAALLCVLPAGRAFSVDAWRDPRRALSSVPAWGLWAVRFQVAVVYFFAGVAKLNHDWLFEAQPLRIWLAARSDWPVVGGLLARPETAFIASWLGAAFDLTIVSLLLAKRTRGVGFVLVVAFHALTAALFPIGIFPWLMTAAATLLLSPSWPRRWIQRFAASRPRSAEPWRPRAWLPTLVALHCAIQLLLPLRQHWSGSPSAWSGQGFNFAWNVMVAEKAGAVSFRAVDRRSGDSVRVEPRVFLARFQEVAMAQDPDMVRQGALFVAERFRRQGRDVAVYADAFASLNGRPARALVDPHVDLTRSSDVAFVRLLD